MWNNSYRTPTERWQKTSDLPKSKKLPVGLPWWRSGWESACQCRGHGFEPWSGKISRAAEQLGPWATITEPAHLEPVLRNKRGRDSERSAHHDEEWPPLAATRESPRTETKTQHSHKKINKQILQKKKKLPVYLGRAKEKRKIRDRRIGMGPAPLGGSREGGKVSTH